MIGDRLGDLDHLHLCRRQRPDQRVRVNIRHLQLLKQFPGILRDLLVVDHHAPDLIWLPPDKDVLTDLHGPDRVEFLEDHRDPGVQNVRDGAGVQVLSLPFDAPFRLRVDAGQDLHQRRFPGAVFSHQGMHRALFDRQGYVIQGDYARKNFPNMFHL